MLLIVDDNTHFSGVLKTILERKGYSFDIVDSGGEAISRILHHGETYSLVLLDLGLPDIGGMEIVQAIRSIGDPEKSDLPIVIMTGGGAIEPEMITEGRIAGVLYKPFRVVDVIHAVTHHARFLVDPAAEAGKDDQTILDDKALPDGC